MPDIDGVVVSHIVRPAHERNAVHLRLHTFGSPLPNPLPGGARGLIELHCFLSEQHYGPRAGICRMVVLLTGTSKLLTVI